MKTLIILIGLWWLAAGFIHETYSWRQIEKQALAADLVEGDHP